MQGCIIGLKKNGKLHPNQAGFRKGRQTIDQLIRLEQETSDAFQKKENVAAVFVDLQQAYDHVWRAGLLYKMQMMGIQGNVSRTSSMSFYVKNTNVSYN